MSVQQALDCDFPILLMDRREALKQCSLLLGGVLATPIATGILAGCTAPKKTADWKPKVFNSLQNDVVTMIAERIIPETDTPGAGAAGVNTFIDVMVADWFSAEETETFLLGLQETLAYSKKKYKLEFLDCSEQQQTELLLELENEVSKSKDPQTPRAEFFSLMKQFTLIGYYTSEIGATQELSMPIMGQYSGNEPFNQNSRAWAW